MKRLLILFVIFCATDYLYAQKIQLGVRSSLLLSNQNYDMLVWQEKLVTINDIIIPISYFASSGKHDYRMGLGVNTFVEIYPYEAKNISILLGVGYRQKGFTTQYINLLGGSTINESSNNRFDHLSISLAERFYINSYYITLGGYLDYLIGRKTHSEFEYIFSHYKKDELSPFIAFGKNIKVAQSIFQIDLEVNPSFKNMLDFGNFFVGRYNSSIKNFAISLNISYRF
ncbi:hypothetical protein [Thermoflexibacter ruber]|uniref:Outer membrane protein beta-barrel domain-containing protein n=1 Tax=Thermoflexibacter ruber TaxID=1003 RepID=A0A1I2JEL6_9BACT|nr:hypothetical protein [Thermoflexibacter ruber]SFF53014.1 hypothetical protein SAMN04488541_104920 [Thermoflexibacter ruber]